MTPRPKKKNDASRVICRCTVFDCHLGRFIDSSGVSQIGVEVLPSTRDTHAQAEQRKEALAKSSAVLSAHHTSAISRTINAEGILHPLNAQLATLSLESSPLSKKKQAEKSPTNVPIHSDQVVQQEEYNSSSKTCSAATKARDEGIQMYDCSRFYATNLEDVNPVLLHIVLTVAILGVFGHLSTTSAAWLFDCLRILIELFLSHGLDVLRSSVPFMISDTFVLQRIPKTITTAIKWLDIDPYLIEMNCCQACFALYPMERTPAQCTHRIARIPGGPVDSDPNKEIDPSVPDPEPLASEFAEETCGHRLLRYARGKELPVRKYAFQRLSDWIARLLSRPDVEGWLDQSLEESRRPFDPKQQISDVHQSKVWKQFQGPDGKQYTATSGNLTFAMFVDAINPYGNKASGKHVSITFIVMVCLTLPIHLRYRPEHVFIVGIAPGPREPSLDQTNWILQPIVTELQVLWKTGLLLSKTHNYNDGRLVRAALLIFIADVPAVRRSLGFPSASAKNFCSICHLPKSQIAMIDPEAWPRRTCTQHRIWAYQARDSKTVKERKKIFETHGVRYSVLNELEYWDIVEYHAIDSMHNLLLGLISWHVRRFWAMKDVQSEEEKLPPITKVELLNLFQEHSQPPPLNLRDPTPASGQGNCVEDDDSNENDTSNTTDEDYDPIGDVGWNGGWTAPPLDEVIFDSTMLKYVNGMLPRIHIPRWIRRAIRVLGKASFGKLKADEWRNLCSLQLPLVLIPIWYGRDPVKTSLLKNFLHLVSLVNLALKREITNEQIDRYRHHIINYLQSSLKLFKHCNLAPNHHLAVHLSEGLEKFGPVRSWWSFPFERLMGGILKGCHNNHVGELEITFLLNACRAGNLAALLRDNKLPDPLKPYTQRLQSFFEEKGLAKKEVSNSDLQPIDRKVLDMLMNRLNNQEDLTYKWLTPEKMSFLSEDDALLYLPLQPRASFHKRVLHRGVQYTTFSESQDDSFVIFSSEKVGLKSFGRIFSIFTHRQSPSPTENTLETWLHIQCFPPIPGSLKHLDPFLLARAPDVQTYLCAWGPTSERLVRMDEIIAHCAWVMYKPGEIHKDLNIPTVALLSMER